MFGTNYIAKKEHETDGETLRIVESSPFYTIQGEGPFTGEPCVFVRLHGCHLACTFCDTQFSDPKDPVVKTSDLVKMVEAMAPRGFVSKARIPLLVITGGEPMRQNILPFVRVMNLRGWVVQIETSGSFWLPHIDKYATIICSPKTSVHDMISHKARAFKYVINADTKFNEWGIPFADTQGQGRDRLLGVPAEDNKCQIYYSPMNEYNEEKNKANYAAVRDASLKYGHTAGVQLHTLLGVA